MKRVILGLLIAALSFASASAQSPVKMQAQAVASCGAQSLTAGVWYPATQDLTGTLCVGSGGGGGGTAVTVANGADVAEGNTADAAATAGSTGTVSAKLRLMTTQLDTLNTTLGSPFQAGGSIGNTSFAVTNAGTFATQSTLAAETTKVIGTVNQGTSPWVVSGAVTNAGTFATQAQPTPVTTGGLSLYNVQPTASDNHVVIKAGAGQVYKISVTNNSATVNYIRLYNATTGFNGCNSATNLVYSNAIPASTSGAGLLDQFDMGIAFATGISICVTSGYAQTDTTNATASAMNVNIGYK